MLKLNLSHKIAFHDDRFVVKKLYDSPQAKYVLFCFKEGQELKDHKTDSAISIQFLAGKALLSVEKKRYEVEAGDLCFIKPGKIHAIQALQQTVMLLTLTPSPSSHTLLKS